MNVTFRQSAPERAAAAALHKQFDRIRHTTDGMYRYLSPEARQLARQVVETRLRNVIFYLRDNNPAEAAVQLSLSADCLQNAVHCPLKHCHIEIDSLMLGFLREAVDYHVLAIEFFRLGLKQVNLPREQRQLANELKYTSRTLRFLYHHDPSYQNAGTRAWLVELSTEAAETYSRLRLFRDSFYEYAHNADVLLDGTLAGADLQPAISAASQACVQAGLYQGPYEGELFAHVANLRLMLDLAAQVKTLSTPSRPR